MTSFSILLLDTEPQTQNRYLVIAIAEALRRHPAVGRVRLVEHGDALKAFAEAEYDTLIAFGGARTHAPLVGRLAALVGSSVLWITEDPYEREANVRGSTAFDLVFTNDRASVSAYGGRALHLPLAASSDFHDFPVVREEGGYLYDLLFVGTAWPNRVETLNSLLPRLPRDLKVKLALPWNEFIGPPDLDDASLVTDWRCGNRDFARLANRSRVVLTLPRVFSAARNGEAAGSTPPPRLFETALAGGFQVVVSPEDETAAYYAPDAEIALCPDEDAAVDAIATMLARPERRIAAARAAQTRTRAEHLYDHRVATIIETLRAHRGRPGQRRQKRASPVRTVLMLTHNRAGRRPGGGVEVYQEVLTGIGTDYRVLFLYPDIGDGHWSLRLEGPGVEETFHCGDLGLPRLTDPHAEGIFQRVLFDEKVDLVHVHHLLHLPLSLPLIAGACGVPVVYHLHDHHLICERWLLLDHSGRFCDVVNRGSDQCDACLAAACNYPPGAKARRDAFTSLVAGAVDAFVTSTPGTAAYLRRFFPEIGAERMVDIEMATPGSPFASVGEHPRTEPSGTGALIVAVPGNFNEHKGGSDVIELIRTCQGYPIHFRIIGRVDAHHLGRLAGLPKDQITMTGPYEQSAVGALLAGCDVSLHLSTWPETYVIALTEAWQSGLVPIVTDLGALAERVTEGAEGFRVPPHAPGTVRARLLELHFDRNRLARMRAAVIRKRFCPTDAHLSALRALYDRLIAAKPCPHERVPDRVRTGYGLKLEDLGIRVNAPSWADSTIRWDGVDSRPKATVRAAIRFAGDLPDSFRGMPSTTLPRATTAWAIDTLQADDRPLEPGGTSLVRRNLFLRGWLRLPMHGPRQALFLRLSGPAGTVWAPLDVDARPDVAESLGCPVAEAGGFIARIDLDGLAFGPHAMSLIAAARDGLFVLNGLPPIFSIADGGTPTNFRPESRPLQAPLALTFEARHNLPEAAGIILATPNDIWAFEARCDGSKQEDPDEVIAVLQDAEGLTWSAATVPTDTGFARFTARMPDARLGRCTFVLTRRTRDGLQPLTRPLSIEIVPTGQLFRTQHGLPDGFPIRFARKRRQAPALETVSRGNEGGRAVVHSRGWALASGLGPPLVTLALWDDDGTQVCIAASLSRHDIAANRYDESALTCGFALAIPEAVLARGHVRFLQRYAGRTVEFKGFRDAIVRAAGLN